VYTEYIYFRTYDVSWASEPVWMWTVVELNGAIICASAPALKVFFKQYLHVVTNRSNNTPARSITLVGGGGRQLDSEKGMKYTKGSYGTGGTEITLDPNEKTLWFDKTVDMEVDNRFGHNGEGNTFDFNGNGDDHYGFDYGNSYGNSAGPPATTLHAASSTSIPMPASSAGGSPQRSQSNKRPSVRGEAGFGFAWLGL
jgi:hypothetical protein